MNKIVRSSLVISTLLVALTGCKSTPVKPPVSLDENIEETKFIVPMGEEVIKKGFVKDINFSSMRSGPVEARQLLNFQKAGNGKFVIHRRVQNESAGTRYASGSGIRYLVNYSVSQENGNYSVSMKPVQSEAYQEGLIGKFDVPVYTPAHVLSTLRSGTVFFSFEIDSPYSESSVQANFERLVNKDSKGYYLINRDKKVYFQYKVVPYRNGSKANFTVVVPAVETSTGVYDFSILSEEAKAKIESVMKS